MPLIFLFDYTAQFIKLSKPVVIGLDNIFWKEKNGKRSVMCMLGFPRDGTSCSKSISLSRCPLVPGQGPEQKSQDKLLCPGMSWDKITFLWKTKDFQCCTFMLFSGKIMAIVLSHPASCPGFWQKDIDCSVPSRVLSRILTDCPRLSCPYPSTYIIISIIEI